MGPFELHGKGVRMSRNEESKFSSASGDLDSASIQETLSRVVSIQLFIGM